MGLKVEVTFKETIRPGSPTPHHLKTLKLSITDQYASAVPVSLVLFYSAKPGDHNAGTDERVHFLKRSLPEILTRFYPLGGRISDGRYVDCSDEGINFFLAQVHCKISDVIKYPRSDDISLLLPVDSFFGFGPKVLLSIQVNNFVCGGMAIAICISHKVADASSLSLFVNCWAALTKGIEKKPSQPEFLTTSLFPPAYDSSYAPSPQTPNGTISKRFVFSDSNVVSLKAKCSSNLHVEQPTRVETVFALIWRCAMNVAKMKTASSSADSASSLGYLIVNLRERVIPPLSDCYVGNLVFGIPTAVLGNQKQQHELPSLVSQLREVKKKTQGEYMRSIQTTEGLSAEYKYFREMNELHEKGELEIYTFTSWCRFPFYEVDFGWGNPVLATPANFVSRNLITLMDTICGKGVEAWITMNEDDMEKFECEPELIAFAPNNPTA